ncbi:hypothetical protein [Caballeronia sp. Lep1P3]|uniref:hypothetical protein n=1 Tax=Caballeronia sp. Lep1P3 TaxID=2878150 RepID=UPI001FD14987|nr:hypothetical protein [Caballeronia sp. Lep1P3]
MASLEFSLAWKERPREIPTKLLIAVPDGLQLDDVARELCPAAGIFIGGSTEWTRPLRAHGIIGPPPQLSSLRWTGEYSSPDRDLRRRRRERHRRYERQPLRQDPFEA